MIFSNATFTLDSAEQKKVWFSNFEKSIGNCWVDLRGDPGGSYLNEPVLSTGAEPDKEARVWFFKTPDEFVYLRITRGVNNRWFSKTLFIFGPLEFDIMK